MGYRLIFLMLLIFSGQSCKSQNNIALNSDGNESNTWKKVATCLCIYQSESYSDEMKKQEGSLAAYLQTNENLDIDKLEEVKRFVEGYLKENNYLSKNGASLSLMRCVKFYDSDKLDEFVKTLND